MMLTLHLGMQVIRRNVGRQLRIGGIKMEMHLQFGYGMMEHCRSLVRDWGNGCVILSPRDLSDSQLTNLATSICDSGGEVMLDPQFYLPYTEHHRLVSHPWWPTNYDSGQFWDGTDLARLVASLHARNQQLGARRFILPCEHADGIDDDWLDRQRAVIDEAERQGVPAESVLASVAMSADAVRNNEQVHRLLDESINWRIGGVYLVCEHPGGDFLVSDPIWLANVLDLTAGFRLRQWEVVLGYCNQQMLIAACASANAIASGTWMNVRSFPPQKFQAQYEEEIRRRTTWYYCPQGYSEYTIPYMDIAQRQGVLNQMAPNTSLGSTYADVLFQGPQPSTVTFSEQSAFRHYLHCLQAQAVAARRSTFDETVTAYEQTLTDAENLLRGLRSTGVTGNHRDFFDMISANRAAISVLRTNRGPMLRRLWRQL